MARSSLASSATARPTRIAGEHDDSYARAMARTPRLYETRALIRRLEQDGWIGRPGKGDHIVFHHPTRTGRVVVDPGKKEIPIGTLRAIYRMAGWEW